MGFLNCVLWWNWWNGIEALATATAAGFAIYLYNQNKKQDNNKYWNDNLPVITIWSPCDVTQNACEIDITQNLNDDINGSCLFRVGNFSKTTAWNLEIHFCSDEHCLKILRKLYIQEIPTTVKTTDENQIWTPIYSKFHIDPNTKETSYTEYNICNSLQDCNSDARSWCIKNLFIFCKYYSSPDIKISSEIISTFKVQLECINWWWVQIKSIVRKSYDVKLQ